MKKYIVVFCVILMAMNTIAQTNTKVVTNLSAERFKAGSANDKNSMIIDLRTTDEITSKGAIKGAVQIDYLAKDAEQKIGKLDKNKTYYIYCAGGGRSGECAEYMEKHGFKRVYNLEKGFSEWVTKGFPIGK
ncbi:MAG: rhodanese-like protein [Bacteroidetes bacterium]|nr:rhodanese-like protein [Bacteroidota bacterium]